MPKHTAWTSVELRVYITPPYSPTVTSMRWPYSVPFQTNNVWSWLAPSVIDLFHWIKAPFPARLPRLSISRPPRIFSMAACAISPAIQIPHHSIPSKSSRSTHSIFGFPEPSSESAVTVSLSSPLSSRSLCRLSH